LSSVASARVAPRSVDPEGVRRHLRYIALTLATARYMAPERARELAANVAGADDDLVTLASITESIERRRLHFGLEISDIDAAACGRAMFAAWTEALS
jgi:hypothetical protein